MSRYLVVSYDDDQEQWFYDVVEDATEEDAEAHICRIRPYVIAADGLNADQLRGMANQLDAEKPEKIKRDLARIERDSNASK